MHFFGGVEVWDLIVGGWNQALQIGFVLTLSDYVQVSSFQFSVLNVLLCGGATVHLPLSSKCD